MVNRSFKRSSRVGPALREAIAEILHRRIQDPRIKGVFITEVDVSPDLRNCKVFYYCTGDKSSPVETQKGLESATGMIRKEVSSGSKMRYTPKISFVYDAHIDQAHHMDQLISSLEPGEEE